MELQESSVIRDIVPQLLNFKRERRAFVLLNSDHKTKETYCGGTKFIIPAKDKLHSVASKRAIDADGDPIPGTIVIEDLPNPEPDPRTGEARLAVDSQETVRHILGIHRMPDGSASSATSPYALGGLSLLPLHPSKELWQAMARDGENRAFLIRVQNAQTTIDEYDAKNAARNSAGMAAVHGGKVYMEARAIIEEYSKLIQKRAEVEVSARTRSPTSRRSLRSRRMLAPRSWSWPTRRPRPRRSIRSLLPRNYSTTPRCSRACARPTGFARSATSN